MCFILAGYYENGNTPAVGMYSGKHRFFKHSRRKTMTHKTQINDSASPALLPALDRLAPLGWPLVRIVTGLLLIPHGAQKLFGWFGGYGLSGTGEYFASSLGMSPGILWAGLAGGVEFFGGLALVLGLLTRPAALGVTVLMAVALSMHVGEGFFWTNGGYEYPLLWGTLSLAILREQGVLITGSGMSYHNMQRFHRQGGPVDPDSERFDDWLCESLSLTGKARGDRLATWSDAPGGRAAHPREEHLLPLHIVAGAAPDEPGVRVLKDRVMGSVQSAFRFGDTI
jgi:putative oxidoreductase